MSNDGKRANRRGKALESFVAELLEEDYQETTKGRFFALRCLKQPIFAKQVVIDKNIYGKDRKVDFILYHPDRWPMCLVIQCKWQSSSGSVEEKYPFEIECIASSEFKTIIVLDGKGYSLGAKKWLKSQCGKRNLITVCDQSELCKLQTEGMI